MFAELPTGDSLWHARGVTASKELMGVLIDARTLAFKRRKPTIETDDVLEVLLRGLPFLKRAVRPSVLRKLPSLMIGVRAEAESNKDVAGSNAHSWQRGATVGLSGECDVYLREVDWLVRVRLRIGRDKWLPAWSEAVHRALRMSRDHAMAHEIKYATPYHLLAGVCTGEYNRARVLLDRASIGADRLLSDLPRRWYEIEGSPFAYSAFLLERTAVVWRQRSSARPAAGAAVLRAAAGGWRPSGFKPLVMAVDREANRQAIRLGASQVNQVHLLLAICVLHNQLDQLGLTFAERWSRHNEAGEVLAENGVVAERLVQRLWGQTVTEDSANRSRPWRNKVRADLPFGASVAAVDERAHAYAAELGHDYAGTSHMLLALLSEGEGSASSLLRSIGVEDRRLEMELRARLGFGNCRLNPP